MKAPLSSCRRSPNMQTVGQTAAFFLDWALRIHMREHPRSVITILSEQYGPVCGYVPADPDGTKIVLWTDDAKCGV